MRWDINNRGLRRTPINFVSIETGEVLYLLKLLKFFN